MTPEEWARNTKHSLEIPSLEDIAETVRAAVVEEREACARIAMTPDVLVGTAYSGRATAVRIAKDIRSRSI